MKRRSVFAKILSAALTFSMILSAVSGISTAAAGEPETWNGTVAENFAGGDGTAADPYLISNGEQLALMITGDKSTGGYSYKLTNDIYLNDVSKDNWTSNDPKSWYDYSGINRTAFVGSLDGAGYAIHGIYYNGSSWAALFPYTKAVTITNLRISDSDLTSSSNEVSALICNAAGETNIKKCVVDDSVKIACTAPLPSTGEKDGKGAGGFVGYGDAYIYIEDSAVMAQINSEAHKGAFFGNCWGYNPIVRFVSNSFSATDAPITGHHANDGTSVTNCYNVGTERLSGFQDKVDHIDSIEKMKGSAAKENMPNLDWSGVWKTTDGYPAYRTAEESVWNGNVALCFAGGKGTQEAPYLISNGAELAKMVKDADATKDKYYVLTNDIKLNDISVQSWTQQAKIWATEGKKFQGNLDGAGHTIYGLYYDGSDNQYNGLVSRADGEVSFKNITISDAYLNATDKGEGSAAAFVGNFQSTGTVSFDTCYITDSVNCTGTIAAGGFVANGSGKIVISNCASLGTFTATGNNKNQKRSGSMVGGIWTGSNRNVSVSKSFGKQKFSDYYLTTVTDSYCAEASSCDVQATVLSEEDMKGSSAKTNMPALDWQTVFCWTTESFPMLRATAQRLGDVTGDYLCDAKDVSALRNDLLTPDFVGFKDFNADKTDDIRDLVYLNAMAK